MNSKLILLSLFVVQTVLARDYHSLIKRQVNGDSGSSHSWSQIISNSWNNLRDQLSSNVNSFGTESRISQIHTNWTHLANGLMNGSTNAIQSMVGRFKNLTQSVHSLMRERINNDSTIVTQLYDSIRNGAKDGTNQTITTLREAFTTATKTMAENYSGLANVSIQMASDLRNKSENVFNNAMVRAGNDTNRAVIAVNTAIDAIRNNSQPMNETVQQFVVQLAKSAQKLSAALRDVMNNYSASVQSIEPTTVTEFRQRAEAALQKLMSSISNLRTSLGQFSAGVADSYPNNEDNEIYGIETALTKESEALLNQIKIIKSQNLNNSN